MAAINPYLNFEGNTEEAFNFYKSVFGTEFLTVMRMKDVPADFTYPDAEGNKIMHIALPIGNGTMLMGSDRPPQYGPVKTGDNMYIAITAGSEEEANRLFNGLAAGGNVAMPLTRSFWNSYFGMLTDKFGIQWMVDYSFETKNNS